MSQNKIFFRIIYDLIYPNIFLDACVQINPFIVLSDSEILNLFLICKLI